GMGSGEKPAGGEEGEVRGDHDLIRDDRAAVIKSDGATAVRLAYIDDTSVLEDSAPRGCRRRGEGEAVAPRMELCLVVQPHGSRHLEGQRGVGVQAGRQTGGGGGFMLGVDAVDLIV